MLKHTLILPDGDAQLAGRLLRDAIDALDMILMLVFGRDALAERYVRWADLLCLKTQMSMTYNPRRVVWIRKPEVKPVQEVLAPILGDVATPRIAVLDFYDTLRATLDDDDTIGPISMERAFLKGGILTPEED